MLTCLLCLLLVSVVPPSYAGDCYSPCECGDDGTIDCSEKELTRATDMVVWLNATDERRENVRRLTFENNKLVLVEEFPNLINLHYLSFKKNRIVRIIDGAFQYLQNLTELDLSHNMLVTPNLSPHIFKGQYVATEYLPMEALEVLRLGFNVLHSLRSDVFEHTPHLKVLTLDDNPLRNMDTPTVQAISALSHLQVLDLSYTDLKVLPQYILHTVKDLQELNLTGNRFTTVPEELENAHSLLHLSLSSNPIKTLTAENGFPASMSSLKVLELNWMPNLTHIGRGSMSALSNLEEFYCSHNHKLVNIDANAFRNPPDDLYERGTWPLIRKMYLKNNNLSRLDQGLLARWDILDELDIEENNWICDCEDQWLVSVLEPLINASNPKFVTNMYCEQPEQMRGKLMFDLKARNYHLRCLDAYGNHPEHDATMLIGVLVGILVAVPATLAVVLYWRRGFTCFRSGPAAYTRAFYNSEDGDI